MEEDHQQGEHMIQRLFRPIYAPQDTNKWSVLTSMSNDGETGGLMMSGEIHTPP